MKKNKNTLKSAGPSGYDISKFKAKIKKRQESKLKSKELNKLFDKSIKGFF